MISLVGLLILTAGIWLIVRGWLGYREGDHPVCRRCGFDLHGKPAGSLCCGECGSQLSNRGAVAIGHQHRRKNLIYAGAVMIFLVVCLLASSMVSINWMSYTPTWLVTWQAESSSKATRSSALAELNARVTNKTLSANDLLRTADAALAYQADLSKQWDTGWGDVLEKLHAGGKLSDTQWKQYLTQALQGAFGLRLRKKVRHGDGLPWEIERLANRSGTGMKLQISFDSSPVEWLSPHGREAKTLLLQLYQTSLSGGGGAYNNKVQRADFPEPLPEGVQQVHIHGTVNVGFPGNTWQINPVVSSEIDLPGTFTLLPANTPIPIDPQQAVHTEQVRNSLSIENVSLSTGSKPVLTAEVVLHSLQLAIDVLVFARTGDQEVYLGGIGAQAQAAGSTPVGMLMQADWPARKPGTVDIIIRSNPDFINPSSWNDDNIWQGEIVFKDVPVK